MTAFSRSETDAILAAIVDGTDDAVVGQDLDGTIITWNTGATRLYGYSADEACGKPVTILVPPDRREELRALEERIARGERIGHFETVRAAKSGRRIDMSLTLAPMRNAAGALIGQSSIARDMTTWTRADRKFVGLLESAPDAIVIVDAHGTIAIVNSQTERLFGYARDELVGRSVETLIPRRYHHEHEAHRARYATAPRTRPMGASRDLYAVHKDGREIPVDVNLSPFDTDEGPLVISSVRDVTERRRFEQTLREQNVALENASLAKDRFLASMSHELRTPLNAVIGFTGTLLMKMPGPLTPEQDRQLRIVGSSAKHLLSLINDLLDLAKIQSGKFDLRLEPLPCQPIVNEVVAALRPTAEVKGLRLVVEMQESEVVVAADRRALSQILLNLASNAIKFTSTGEVRLRLHGTASRTVIEVIDTGPGISDSRRDRLFRPFERLDDGEREVREGTGLGLHLSQELARLLKGHIECRSEIGVGSTFSVILPVCGADPSAVHDEPAAPAADHSVDQMAK